MKTLEQYREEFKQKKLMTMPLAGTIVWFILGCMALVLPQEKMVLPLYIGTGSIFYLALFLSKFTGEKLLVKSAEMNPFDKLFLYTMVMSLFCFSMAIPFGLQDYTSLPMTIGILTGLMWLPISWTIQHNVGIVHTTLRTLLIMVAWFAFPENRFVTIPFIIVFVYAISLVQLYLRHKKVHALLATPVANS
ncbi:MAG: hypothetical protein CL811_01930 [Colwelliaceae bacterium]|nr:hypothetical protein [Colwelliaceae bacterium]|tara:strand:- start:219 stop:791 length:573 start_codon:yes stop_codon:yes gene_type:complete